jgi:hypothetical protein
VIGQPDEVPIFGARTYLFWGAELCWFVPFPAREEGRVGEDIWIIFFVVVLEVADEKVVRVLSDVGIFAAGFLDYHVQGWVLLKPKLV